MNIVETDFFHGPAGFSYTIFSGRDCSAGTDGAIVDVLHVGQGTIDTASEGWTKIGSGPALHGNIQANTIDGTLTTFAKDGPLSASEELVVSNTYSSGSSQSFAASLKLMGAAS